MNVSEAGKCNLVMKRNADEGVSLRLIHVTLCHH